MRRRDWTVPVTARSARERRPDITLRLLLLGERVGRPLLALVLVATTVALCLAALIGPEALVGARAEALPGTPSRLRLALSGVFG